jgi:hypothetical protein
MGGLDPDDGAVDTDCIRNWDGGPRRVPVGQEKKRQENTAHANKVTTKRHYESRPIFDRPDAQNGAVQQLVPRSREDCLQPFRVFATIGYDRRKIAIAPKSHEFCCG